MNGTTQASAPSLQANGQNFKGDAPVSKAPTTVSEEELQRRIKESVYIDYSTPITLYEGIKLLVMSVLFVPRLIIGGLTFCYLNMVARWALLGVKPLEPIVKWKADIYRREAKRVASMLLFITGYWKWDVKGRHILDQAEEQGAIYVFNHLNYMDPVVMSMLVAPAFVAKSGVSTMPIVGMCAVALQVLFVQRRDSVDKGSKWSIQGKTTDLISERYANGKFPPIALAPEATTKAKHCILPFQTGAFVHGRPVCCVLIKQPYRHFNPGWGLGDGLLHLWRMSCQFRNYLEVEIAPLYYPSAAEQADPRLQADNVREYMSGMLGKEGKKIEQSVTECTVLQRAGVIQSFMGDGYYISQRKPRKGTTKKTQ